MTVNVLGVDPGPIPGIVTLHYLQHPAWALDAVHAYQCSAPAAPKLLALLLDEYGDCWAAGGIEQFVQGTVKTDKVTARQIPVLMDVAAGHGLHLGCLPAGTVKPWATARRMASSGVWAQVPAKLPHARSAAQVALYWGCRNGGVPDPLSREWKAA
jgi:hypothetical protein